MNKTKRGKEDYLRAIHQISLEERKIRSKDIAGKLGISKPSVSEMLRKLHKEGLVKIKPYSKIFLTKKGKLEAEKNYFRYETIKDFLIKFLNSEKNSAEKDAHNLEHAFSQETIERMRELLQGKKINEKLPCYIG